MSFNLTIQIDPHAVLGIEAGASMLDIREAYRRKAKQHHPDVGGEAWAFRIVSQAYEILSTARVMQATYAEAHAGPGPEHASPGPGGAGTAGSGWQTRDETVRSGVSDKASDPAKVVDVEKLWVRYEVDHVWLLHAGKGDERFLSCSLNISWPGPELASRAAAIPGAAATLSALRAVFEEVHIHTPAVNSRCHVEDDRFQGWLSYSSPQLVGSAFNKLHEELNARGLSVKQWTRDLLIPRDWR